MFCGSSAVDKLKNQVARASESYFQLKRKETFGLSYETQESDCEICDRDYFGLLVQKLIQDVQEYGT